MHAIKAPAFLRPSSRPSSPAPQPLTRTDSGGGYDRSSRPLNRLSLTGFRRPSPSPTLAFAPVPTTLIQDGCYLEMLSLKLSEAVSKALAQPAGPAIANEQVAGKRPIPAGRGHALGALIASELEASKDSSHLQRAVIRCLHRPLSVLLTNLSAQLLPLLNSPAFHATLATTSQQPTPNATQLHALALVTFSSELLEAFDSMGLGLDADFRGDGLRGTREGLVSVVTRVVNPLVTNIKNEILSLLEALETPAPTKSKASNGAKAAQLHSSILTLQATMPVYARVITRCTTPSTQSSLASFLISIIWRALLAFAHRPHIVQPTTPLMAAGLTPSRSTGSASPNMTPPSGRFTIKLPPSRPPSPPASHPLFSAAADARALFELFNLFPRPVADKEATRLAREAVDEAFAGLQALPPLLEAVMPQTISRGRKNQIELEEELERLTADVPTLIALPIILQSYNEAIEGARSVAPLLGLSEEAYRKGCLSGFSRAEECAAAVSQRVLDALVSRFPVSPIVTAWLEAEIALVLADL